MFTETTEEVTTVEETTNEETTAVAEEETTTTEEETTTEVEPEFTTEEETTTVEEVVAPVVEEPAPAPSSEITIYFIYSPADGWLEAMQQTASDLGLTMTVDPMTDGYDVIINAVDGDALNSFYDALWNWGDVEVYQNVPGSPYTYYKYYN